MDAETSAFDAATGQKVLETLDALRATARGYTGDQNVAAPRLAADLMGICTPDMLASALANLLLHDVRLHEHRAQLAEHPSLLADEIHEIIDGVARCRFCGCTEDHACPGGCWWADDEQISSVGLEPLDGDVCTTCVHRISTAQTAQAGPALDGVEVRLIGPQPAVKAVQDAMSVAGVPQIGQTLPFPARDRDGCVRVYSATDAATARNAQDRAAERSRRTRRGGAGRRGGTRGWGNHPGGGEQ